MKIELESTSDRCHYNGPRPIGERFFAKESEAVVLTGLGRAKRVFAAEPAPTAASLADLADKGPRRKGRVQAKNSDKPRRAYKRRDMRAEV